MQIHKIETFPLLYRLPKPYGDANGIKAYRTCYLIRITTNTGIEGWGECVDWLPTLQKGFHERIIPYLIGKSVTDRSNLVSTLKKWHSRSSAAVSMALTEIMAKSCGISVCDLWGGKFREKVPVYASFQSYSEEADWKDHSLRIIEKVLNQGFDKIKLKIGGKSISEDQQHIVLVQTLLQGKINLALDANQSYDVNATLRWQSLLETWPNFLWFEEPLKLRYIAEYALLRNRLFAPLAGGENIENAADYIPILNQNALDYITPDPLHIAGIDSYREALNLARSFGIRVTPHTYDGALSRLYAIFAHANLEPWSKMGTDSIEPLEWDVMDNPFAKLVPVRPLNGEVAIPSGSGIGIEIDLDILAFYHWDGSNYV
ncbi:MULTISPECIES: mandelate racemase/muconate lactonizing enzyme family protein [unclassified Paenibacillus]|uniref:mandelate racemase/muconate lactonizing enzyme family protein n=1 Tax=unclassified Paenibacillus TaxID=185978 RepID=UPI0027899153|nr:MULTISPECIES: mandelate racemase/muconate lactonizing enzyme family protein [unclassified Paenibacillus]MDQ0899028.1 L-alanine-DL-glutamate epimerase-like enolase superfamily enzyme [Paenibacillus sp. V4I7]MDQ0914985.1 L-alanine-DL-glutamate epimerase-like enolase superfamily enzyme [Paenibacillus sp. V4I5]